MPKYLPLVAMLMMSGSQVFGANGDTHYTVAQFSNDCQLSGGVPRIFNNSAVCEEVEGQNITCLRQADAISACKLESPSQTSLTQNTTSSIQRRLLMETLR